MANSPTTRPEFSQPPGETTLALVPETLTGGLTLFRKGRNNVKSSSRVFVKDDGVLLAVSSVETGNLPIKYRGTDSDIQLPSRSKNFLNGRSAIEQFRNTLVSSAHHANGPGRPAVIGIAGRS